MNRSLEELLVEAAQVGASSVLFLVGRPPVARIGGELQPPLDTIVLTFHETEKMAQRLLTPQEIISLNQNGSVETEFLLAGVKGNLTVFFGGGSHNLVFYL